MSAVTVSVMFSDMVGSTETLVRVGEGQMEALRRELFAVLRDAAAEHQGDEVKNVGDGLMFVFPSASALVEGAVGVQQRLDARNRDATEPLSVRIGLATGDADAADGDYFGAAVVEAARLCAAADGGQILATETVQLLSRQRTDHEYVALGARAFKGFDEPIPVCEVIWEPLTAEELGAVPLPARLKRPPGAPFVGRADERTVLMDALKAAQASSRRHVLLSGEAGIGKTTLLADFARAAHDQGAIVLYGRCDEDLSIPYEPWREVLAHLDKHLPEALDESRAALGVLLRTDPQPSGMDANAARYTLYSAVVDTLARAASTAPLVVVLEDLHWADAPTVALVRHLARSSEQRRVMLVATFRDTELDGAHPLIATLASLHREQSIERLALKGLDDLELLSLLETLAGHEMGDDGLALRDALRAETDGNPFFATEILRHLAETGVITQRADGEWIAATDLRSLGLPVSVREVIGLRVGRLGEPAHRALQYAAVIGRDFDLEVLAELLGEEIEATHAVLAPALESAVVADVAPNRFSFGHALIGHTLYDELTPTTRARAHHELAKILERHLGDDVGGRAGELAHHWSLATAPRDVDKAADYARRAGDYALLQLAPDEAVRWYQQALELTESGNEIGRCEVLVGLGEAQRQAGITAYRETLLEACRAAIALDASELLVRGALANSRGGTSEYGAIDHDRTAMLRAAIATGPKIEDRAVLHGLLALELQWHDLDEARRAADNALALARVSASDRTFAWVAILATPPLQCPANRDRIWRFLQEAHAAADRARERPLRMRLALSEHVTALQRSNLLEADRFLQFALPETETIPEPFVRWFALFLSSVRVLLAGDVVGAESLADQAYEYGSTTGQPNAFGVYAGQLFEIRRAQGRLDEVIGVLEQAVTETSGIAAYRAGLAVAFCDLNRAEDARLLLQADIESRFESFPFDLAWTTAILFAAEACAQVGGADAADALVEKLEPWRDHVAYSTITGGGSLARGLGLALAAKGRTEEAVEAFHQALEVNERLEAPILVARTELDLAHTLRHADPSRARALAASAASTAVRLGLGTIERRTRSLLDDLR